MHAYIQVDIFGGDGSEGCWCSCVHIYIHARMHTHTCTQADIFGEVMGEKVVYNAVPRDVYASFGFPGN
jgi:hypothetical protein